MVQFIGRIGFYILGDRESMVLRFGITALEFQEVAKSVIIDGIPDFSQLDVPTLINDTASQGWSVLELSLDVKHVIPNSVTPEIISRLLNLKNDFGLSYTVHLPY